MHQYKELIDDIDIKYIEMPNKLEWVSFVASSISLQSIVYYSVKYLGKSI